MASGDYISFQRTQFAEALAQLSEARLPWQNAGQHSGQPVEEAPLTASIILVNYNGWHDLQRCLASLEASPVEGCEVIVIDNNSTDDSPQRIERRFPTVRLIRSAINLGFGAGNNLGAKLALGRVLVFLNPDTTVEPGWLDPLVGALDRDPRVGMATPRILLLNDPGRINTCGNDLHLSGLTLCRGMGRPYAAAPGPKDLAPPVPQAQAGLVPATGAASKPAAGAVSKPATGAASKPTARAMVEPVAVVSGAAFAIRRDLFEDISGFDETFFLYMEDTDLSLRARMAGFRCVYVPDSVVYHDYELSFGPMKIYYQERNRYLMLLKSLRWPTLLVLLPTLLLSEILTWGYVFLRDPQRKRNKLFAYAWVLYWWQQIMEKRRQTQRQRRVPDRALLHATSARIDFSQADDGWAAYLAHLIFDPLFTILRLLALALVWW